MSELSTLAQPYSEAVFKLAKANKSITDWSNMLSFLAIVVQDEQLKTIISNPKISQEKITNLLLHICQNELNLEATNLLKLLIQNSRLMLAPQISEFYEVYKADYEGYIDVKITSAHTMSAKDNKQLTTTLNKMLHKNIHIYNSIDKNLIAGLLIHIGDKVINASIKGALQQLAKKL